MTCLEKMLKEVMMAKSCRVEVPKSWINKFTEMCEENTAMELCIADMEAHIQELVDCIMTQGKMLEEVGVQPLTPEVLMTMMKSLDDKEKKLSEDKEEFKKRFKSIIPDKKDWN